MGSCGSNSPPCQVLHLQSQPTANPIALHLPVLHFLVLSCWNSRIQNPQIQTPQILEANCASPLYIRDLNIHGFWDHWMAGGGGCSWNQFPMNAEGCLYLFCFLGVRGHWVKIPALPRISSKLLPSLPRRPSLCSSHCKTWGIKDLGRDKWPHLEAGEAQPCSFTLCFHTPAH